MNKIRGEPICSYRMYICELRLLILPKKKKKYEKMKPMKNKKFEVSLVALAECIINHVSSDSYIHDIPGVGQPGCL